MKNKDQKHTFFFLSVLVWQTKLIHYCLVKDDQKKNLDVYLVCN